MKFDFDRLIGILKAAPLLAQCKIQTRDEVAQRAFYKIRCTLSVAPYKLDIKIISTATGLIYAYQLFSTKALLRGDNEPHFPDLDNFPHHFHNAREEVLSSSLSGHPEKDITSVLREIADFLTTTET